MTNESFIFKIGILFDFRQANLDFDIPGCPKKVSLFDQQSEQKTFVKFSEFFLFWIKHILTSILRPRPLKFVDS